jgi:methyl-accepting chemotaxis protein
MKRLTLTGKLMLGGMAIVLAAILCVGVASTIETSSHLETVSKYQVQRTAQDIAELIQLALQMETKMAVEIAAGNSAVDAGAMVTKEGKEKAASLIENLQRKLASAHTKLGDHYEAIVAMDLQGIVYADSLGGKLKGLNAGDREYFKLAKEGKCNIGSVSKSKATTDPVTQVAAPILSDQNEIVGVIVIVLKVDYLIDTVVRVKVGNTGYAFMVDQNGVLIAHPDKNFILTYNMNTTKGLDVIAKTVLSGEPGAIDYVFNGSSKIAGYAPVKLTGWSVVASLPWAEARAPVRAAQKQMALISAILIAVVCVVIYIFGRRISKPITTAVQGLINISDQVAAGASQVAISSQQLAEGTSEQAAAIEETSSTLEQMSSMTKRNAENANEANKLMGTTRESISQANRSMEKLTSSMSEISKASEETSQIIKTIDEIAFQTNLLALNAAVEAARAGEAGAGFAVVADEVRNLAMKAAEAADTTANLVEGTVKKVKEGSELVANTETRFHEVANSVGSSSELVGEITAASQEQAQGIEQVSKATSEMDKVVQQNAANAQESASASAEMRAQAERMKEFINELVRLVDGVKSGQERDSGEPGREAHVSIKPPVQSLSLKDRYSSTGTGAGNDLSRFWKRPDRASQSFNNEANVPQF